MKCKQCQTELTEGAAFCTNCGSQQNAEPTTEPSYGIPSQEAAPNNGNVGFGEAIKLYFQNYANFTGRASKNEYWWAFLFAFLVNTAASYIPVIGSVISLALIIPSLSIAIRRLHDTGKSWVYYLMGLIPLAGFIILIVYFCKDSDGDNQWGPGPVNA